ncbi:TPA: hypothetical protein ACJCCX_003835, partial [Acinetobacter baumannii]|nr:hypothetical protein [Acinetobacter baumannii]
MYNSESKILAEYEKAKKWDKYEKVFSRLGVLSFFIFMIMIIISALTLSLNDTSPTKIFNSYCWAAILFFTILFTSLRNIAEQISFKKSMEILIDSNDDEGEKDHLPVVRRQHTIICITAFCALIVADFIIFYFVAFNLTLPLNILINKPLFIIMLACLIFFALNYMIYKYKFSKLNNEVTVAYGKYIEKKR